MKVIQHIHGIALSALVFASVAQGVASTMNNASPPAERRAPAPVTMMPVTSLPSQEPADWRDFRTLSAHPNGDEIFFIECLRTPSPDYRVMRLNLKTRALAYYDLPKGYLYFEAYVSPSGNKLALTRRAEAVETYPETLAQLEIAVMNTDGSGFEVLPLAKGGKFRPTFNRSDDKLAFWHGEPRRQPAKTKVTDLDVYEYDFKTGKEAPFGASYRFFLAGDIFYVGSGDELLLRGEGPMDDGALFGLGTHDFSKRYPNPIYRLRRGASNWVAPLFADEAFRNARALMLTPNGGLLFEADPPRGGKISIYRQEPGGDFSQWSLGSPWDVFGAAMPSLVVMGAQAEQVLGIFVSIDDLRERRLKRFLSLDLKTGVFRAVSIPAFTSARAIPVRVRDRQEVKSPEKAKAADLKAGEPK